MRFMLSFCLLASPSYCLDQSDMLVSTDWLARNLGDSSLILLHVSKGDRKTYDEGHIPAARRLGWEDFVTERDGVPNELPDLEILQETFRNLGIEKGQRIVLYDEVGGVPAARAYFTLDSVGLADNASLLDGHLRKWKADGRELSKDSSAPTTSSIELKWNRETLATRDRIAKVLSGGEEGAKVPLLDCRKPSQYTGEQGAGHLPGALSVPLKEHFTDDEASVLRPIRDLLGLYAAKGIAPGMEVVTYCNTGRSASHAYFILKYLGYKPRLYDGSMSEWSADPQAPVATGSEP